MLGRPQLVGAGDSGVGTSVETVDLAADGTVVDRTLVAREDLADYVRQRAADRGLRWVWSDTPHWYSGLLAAGVRVERCHDLRLSHAILKRSQGVEVGVAVGVDTNADAGVGAGVGVAASGDALRAAVEWDAPPALPALAADPVEDAELAPTLFELAKPAPEAARLTGTLPSDIDATLAEFARQRESVDAAAEPGRLALLLAAESAGALIGCEMTFAGLPWDRDEHDRILRDALGPQPEGDAQPEKLAALGDVIRAALGDSSANLDSPPRLLRALREAGIPASSTSRWELIEYDHPAIEPLLQYKRLARLWSANGWAWLDEWVHDGRYRPVYVPGGVVTGRWASSGGGALQLPRTLRTAVRADPGWLLVSADVAQLEPRILAAMSGDRAMARAGAGRDLYAGIVESGAVASRQEAKIALLGAMYGSTTGESGRLVPRLRHEYPDAMRLVDEAAAVGEQGGVVSTWLGRSSPPPGPEWHEAQSRASLPGATRADEDRARRVAREFGRFTRNFVVQGTAAEWALAWLAGLRTRLCDMGASGQRASELGASELGTSGLGGAELVFFLHDEIIVHTPAEYADEVAAAVTASADAAARMLFGDGPVEFPLDLRIAERASKD